MAKNNKLFRGQADHSYGPIQLRAASSCYSVRSTVSRSKDDRKSLKPVTGLHKRMVHQVLLLPVCSGFVMVNNTLAV